MKYELTPSDKRMLEENFVYHAPKGDQSERYVALRELGKNLAANILESCPLSSERSMSLTRLQEALFWANASIARHEYWANASIARHE